MTGKQNRYIHTVDCYAALRRKESLTPAPTWMNLEDTMLSEISQIQKDKHCMIVESKKVEATETESRMVIARDWGEWGGMSQSVQSFSYAK